MKKISFLSTIFFLVLQLGNLSAQDSSSRKLTTHEPGARAQSIYFELMGPGATYSFNYDTRFQNTLNGLGARAGISYLATDGNGVFSAPVMINYLLGKEGKYFELGIGATYINFSSEESASDNEVLFVDETTVFGTMVIGYRKQPVDGGFMFRVGLSPFFGEGNFIPYHPYISLGYTF